MGAEDRVPRRVPAWRGRDDRNSRVQQRSRWMLIAGSAIGLYYYLRIIYMMLQPAAADLKDDPAAARLPFGVRAVMAAMTIAILWLGVYPMPLIATLQSLASTF